MLFAARPYIRPEMNAQMRIVDLKRRTHAAKRLLNVAIPVKIHDTIGDLAEKFHVSKTEVVVALLNEGLSVAASQKRKAKRGD